MKLYLTNDLSNDEKMIVESFENQEIDENAFLRLEQFDDYSEEGKENEETKKRDWKKWIGIIQKNGETIEAVSKNFNFSDNKLHWKECNVVGYDEEKKMFKIKWKDNNKEKYVFRFNLIFKGNYGENEKLFFERKNVAHLRRKKVEREIKLCLTYKNVENSEVAQLSKESINNIIKRVYTKSIRKNNSTLIENGISLTI